MSHPSNRVDSFFMSKYNRAATTFQNFYIAGESNAIEVTD